MFGTDNREVPVIQRRDDFNAESFGKRHDGGIDGPKREIVIAGYELRDAHPIAWQNRRGGEVSR
jgi:hypothetical protein